MRRGRTPPIPLHSLTEPIGGIVERIGFGEWPAIECCDIATVIDLTCHFRTSL